MKILLVQNELNEEAVRACAKFCEVLNSRKIDYATEESLCKHSIESFDYCISLGGDGTILKTARLINYSSIPILGLNYGHLGFLVNKRNEDFNSVVDSLISNAYIQDKRTVLHVEGIYEDGSSFESNALNEVVFSRGNSGRIIRFDVQVNGKMFTSLRGDGVMVATATGSTGYALSTGGPIVDPSFDGLEVVPIAAHSLFSRPLILADGNIVTIKLATEPDGDVCVFVDGIAVENGSEPAEISVRVADKKVVLLRTEHYDFYNSLSNMFFRTV